tara:strand:+ start:139 stop:420 length:282 start_codon:yes stop_codon:yes gene_type:complete
MKKASVAMDLAFKVVVTANLVFVNYVFFNAYSSLRKTLNAFQGEFALQMEERLAEEYEYFTKDLQDMKENLLESQKGLIPSPTKVKSGPPILF